MSQKISLFLHVPFLKVILALFSFAFIFQAVPVYAQSISTTSLSLSEEYLPSQTAYVQNSSPNIATKALYDFGHAISCILAGTSPLSPCLQYDFTKNLQGSISATPYLSSLNTSGGLLGLGDSALALLYQEKPLDQQSFFAYLGKSIGLVDEASAQVGGSGNQVLSPIFALWTVSRNIAYLMMILIFIGVGVMVMFRQKLNPQTVITAQMALPGLVIGLILITFSYFLASLITDIAYVGTDLVGAYFNEAIKINGGTAISEPLTERLADHNPLSIGAKSTDILKGDDIKYFVDEFYRNLPPWTETTNSLTQLTLLNPTGIFHLFVAGMTYMLYNGLLAGITDIIGGGIGLFGAAVAKFGSTRGAAISALGPLAGGSGTFAAGLFGAAAYKDPTTWLAFWVSILAVLILIYTVVRLVFRLLNNYLMIIFLTISSPFVFLASSLPGRQGMATDWARNMLCNVLAFPAVVAVLYFAAFLIGNNQIPGFGVSQPFNLTGAGSNLPLLGGLKIEFLRKIIAFVAILATPSIPDIICKSVGKPGQAAGVLAGAVSGAIGGGQRYQNQISGQIQKASSDVGTWKGALFGKKQYTGGRFGALQTKLDDLDNKDYNFYTGDPDLGKSVTTRWGRARRIISQGIEGIRMADPSTMPQSPYQTDIEGAAGKGKRRGGYG